VAVETVDIGRENGRGREGRKGERSRFLIYLLSLTTNVFKSKTAAGLTIQIGSFCFLDIIVSYKFPQNFLAKQMLSALASPIHKAADHLDNIPIFSYGTSPFKGSIVG
jgi:hypothetical protein